MIELLLGAQQVDAAGDTEGAQEEEDYSNRARGRFLALGLHGKHGTKHEQPRRKVHQRTGRECETYERSC